ncbi:CotS family spore coat protein [Paenibacillus sp. LMG 31461]|uniref:CotS family spore coat protein n=1 Tax=Paenibacillus plantarum TaxID=2654975 RepID=A0ABX1X8K3_9BACL|nr:CotS family spore coat protein [Paenibacillus plantarum]NOU64785.1 CotS family spore coat protein [Paenibacillus plantarum]
MGKGLLAEIAINYDLSIKQVERIRNTSRSYVMKITTDQGSFILKRMNMDEYRLQFILETEEFLKCRGINIPSVYQTNENKNYVRYKGYFYVLQEWICAVPYPLSSLEHVIRLADLLGRMHAISKEYQYSQDLVRIGGTNWEQEYKEALHFLGKWRDVNACVDEPWRKAVLAYVDFYMRTGEFVKENVRQQECCNVCGETHIDVVISHHDFHTQNILLDEIGNIYMIDWEFVRFDLPSRDINRLLYAMIKKSRAWNHHAFLKVMRAYLKRNTLSKREMKLLYLDLAFPHNLCRNLIWGKFNHMTVNQINELLQKDMGKTQYMIESYLNQ